MNGKAAKIIFFMISRVFVKLKVEQNCAGNKEAADIG